METPESRLNALGLALPNLPTPGGNYLPFVRVGNLLYLAGTICTSNGQLTHTGQVGIEHDVKSAYEGARVCALNLLAAIKLAAGDLAKVKRFVTVNGYVNAVAGFADSPAVINGASDLFVAVFGDAGKHARAAVAVAGLPRNSTVEVQAVVELADPAVVEIAD
jgi:enamine deaminase RidA (YjgF/YER057c/UK114 family)